MVDYIAEVVLKEENSGAQKNGSTNGSKNGSKNGTKNGSKNGTKTEENSVSAQEAAESLIDLALAEGSTDNISAIIVKHL